MREFKWLWKHMGEKRHYLIIALILSALTSATLILNPMLSKKLIDEVIIPQQTEKLIPILAIMVGIQSTRQILRYIMVMLLEKNSQNMLDRLKRKLYDVIQNQDHYFYSVYRTGDLMTRLTNDLDLLRHGVAWISYVALDSVVVFVVTIIYFFTVSKQMTLFLILVTPFIIILTRLFSSKIKPIHRESRDKLSELNTISQENIAGNRVVKAFAAENFEINQFDKKNKEYKEVNLKASIVSVKFQPIIELLSQSLNIITLLVGGLLIIDGKLSPGSLIAFTSLTWALSGPLQRLSMLINDTQRFFTSCKMIMDIYNAKPSVENFEDGKILTKRAEGNIKFENVSLTINRKKILENINFQIEKGKTIGIIGPTGSGKTSLINLIMRFYDPTEGKINLDGENIKYIDLSSLRKEIGTAMQEVFLFSDTVDKNIAYGNEDLTFEEVQNFSKLADVDSFAVQMSNGYNTLIGERGIGLSGGQKQRISLARALAVEPSILILDDTTSAVDMETEKYIQKSLLNLKFICTKFIIAQRISSLEHADTIIVLEEGKILEQGNHEELLKNKKYYYNTWALQNSILEGENN